MRLEVVIFLAAMLSPVARALPSGGITAQVPSRCDNVIFCNSISRLRGGQWRQVAGFLPCLKKTKRIIEVKPPPAPSFHQVYVQVIEVVTLLFPLWLAPNIITLCGLMCTMSTYVVFHYYCPFLYGVAPWWAYVMNALAILGYQALDAMDGKQARRTGSGSPLGLLFDHGCDAFNGTIMSLTMSSVAQTGPGLVSFAMCVPMLHTPLGRFERCSF